MENIPFYRRTTAHRELHLVDRLPVWLKRVLTGEVSPEVQPYQQMDRAESISGSTG